MEILTLKDIDLKGKKVLLRVDFNVPLNDERQITDDTRIRASLPTIEYILSHGGSIILMSHLGRPKGKKDPAFSLKPCAEHLAKLLNKPVHFAPDCIGKKVQEMVSVLKPGEMLMLENLRFYPAEENPEQDPSFAKNLAALADIYVSDAFGTAHRAHSSTVTIAQYFPDKSVAGLLLEKEIAFLGKHFAQPKHPFYAIIGGAKVSSKLGILHSLLLKADALFIGGGMAYTFFKAQGISIGNSLCEEELVDQAQSFLQQAKKKKISVFFPEDFVIANAFKENATHKIIPIKDGIPQGWQGMDIGPKTIENWTHTLSNAQMIFWNGPLGVFEFPSFSKGTKAIAETLAHLPAITIIGGGDSVAAINQINIADKFSHISTGGGATLEYIENGHLPGIDALSKKSY